MIAARPETQTDTVRGRTQRGARLLLTASALLFGVFGWLAAHAATFWLLGHAGPGSAGTHHHPHLSGAALLVGFLAGGSLLATFAVALRGEPLHAYRQRSRQAAARRTSLLSTAAFIGAEFIEHAVTGQHDVPPWGVLLLGCIVHAAVGAGTSILWGWWVDDLLQLAALMHGCAPTSSAWRVRWHARRQIAVRRSWQVLAMAGRAPPQRSLHPLDAHL